MVVFVKHLPLVFLVVLLSTQLFQGVHDGVDAESLAVLAQNLSCHSVLNILSCADLTFSVRVPNCGCILKNRSNKGFVYNFLRLCHVSDLCL